MPAFIDLTGQKFGRLTVIERTANKGKEIRWSCVCDCGKELIVHGGNLRTGNSKSCGCFHLDVITIHGHATRREKHPPEYEIWRAIHRRCNNPNDAAFKSYGGRGIAVCDRWDSYENFLKDIGKRPSEKHSLDRINNDKGYSLENCRWATKREQSRNRRNNHLLTYKGETKCMVEWSEIIGIRQDLIYSRIKAGMTVKQTFETPVRKKRKNFAGCP